MSEYYDSDDPPSLILENNSDDEEVDQSSKIEYIHPFYNMRSKPPEIELGILFVDNIQFKSAMIKWVVYNKRNIYWKKNERKSKSRMHW